MASNAVTLPKSAFSAGNEKAKSQPKARKSSSLPAETVDYLKAWMMSPEHVAHPYPTEQEKAQIMADTGIELKQLTNWFVNNRKRFWKPRVEARLQKEAKARATSMRGDKDHTLTTHSAKPQAHVKLDMTPRQSVAHPWSRNCITTDNNEVPHAVSVGSSSSLSSESDINSFDDDDDAIFSGTENVQIIDRDGIIASKRARCVTTDSDDDHLPSSPKRSRTTKNVFVDVIPNDSPRPDFLSMDMEKWRDVCRNARHGFENSLPTLEEAAHMFGYAD